MNDQTKSRRKLLKQAGLGLGLAASVKLTASTACAAGSSKTKQLLQTDVLVVGITSRRRSSMPWTKWAASILYPIQRFRKEPIPQNRHYSVRRIFF